MCFLIYVCRFYFWLNIYKLYINCYILVILYVSVLRLLDLIHLFYWFIESWTLYHNGTDNKNETTFSLLYTLLVIISSWNSSWMYFCICHNCITVLVTSLIIFCLATPMISLLWKLVSETKLEKRFTGLNWESLNGAPKRYFKPWNILRIVWNEFLDRINYCLQWCFE